MSNTSRVFYPIVLTSEVDYDEILDFLMDYNSDDVAPKSYSNSNETYIITIPQVYDAAANSNSEFH